MPSSSWPSWRTPPHTHSAPALPPPSASELPPPSFSAIPKHLHNPYFLPRQPRHRGPADKKRSRYRAAMHQEHQQQAALPASPPVSPTSHPPPGHPAALHQEQQRPSAVPAAPSTPAPSPLSPAPAPRPLTPPAPMTPTPLPSSSAQCLPLPLSGAPQLTGALPGLPASTLPASYALEQRRELQVRQELGAPVGTAPAWPASPHCGPTEMKITSLGKCIRISYS